VQFLAIVREDDNGDPATADTALWYSNKYDFNFATAPDAGNHWATFMGEGYPTNMVINVRAMTYEYTRDGLMTPTEIRGKLNQLLQ
jgi:hypothetical protein